MKFKPRRGLGILLMAVSVIFLVTALYTLLFYVGDNSYRCGEAPPRHYHGVIEEHMQNRGETYSDDVLGVPNMGPIFPYWREWPYRWLSKPLAIVGISLFLAGLFVGYRDDISEIF